MSRIGKKAIDIPKEVSVTLEKEKVTVKANTKLQASHTLPVALIVLYGRFIRSLHGFCKSLGDNITQIEYRITFQKIQIFLLKAELASILGKKS